LHQLLGILPTVKGRNAAMKAAGVKIIELETNGFPLENWVLAYFGLALEGI